MDDETLGYIARVDMGFDVKKNREKTLRFCTRVSRDFHYICGIPNLSYNDFKGEENFLFYYNHDKTNLEFFKEEIEKEGLVKEVTICVIRESAFGKSDTCIGALKVGNFNIIPFLKF